MWKPLHRIVAVAIASGGCVTLTGCGLNIQSPDLFLIIRTGQGTTLKLLVNDDGTIKCNGGPAKTLSDQALLQARDLADDLNKDAKSGLRISAGPSSVYSYTVKLPDGTIMFPETGGAAHHELARAELFAIQATQGPCAQPPR